MGHYWRCPQLWPGGDVAIIGGGPSFKDIDQAILKAHVDANRLRVIGVNKAYKEVSDNTWIDMIFFGDPRFYDAFRHNKAHKFYEYTGLRVTNMAFKADTAVKFMRRKIGGGLSDKSDTIVWQKNSGGAAINLACHCVGTGGRIFLFGFDMCVGAGKETHWHKGYYEINRPGIEKKTREGKREHQPYHSWLATFKAVKRDLNTFGISAFNVNPKSKIIEFPRIDFDTFNEMLLAKGVSDESPCF
jgi:hypothetical protein